MISYLLNYPVGTSKGVINNRETDINKNYLNTSTVDNKILMKIFQMNLFGLYTVLKNDIVNSSTKTYIIINIYISVEDHIFLETCGNELCSENF